MTLFDAYNTFSRHFLEKNRVMYISHLKKDKNRKKINEKLQLWNCDVYFRNQRETNAETIRRICDLNLNFLILGAPESNKNRFANKTENFLTWSPYQKVKGVIIVKIILILTRMNWKRQLQAFSKIWKTSQMDSLML